MAIEVTPPFKEFTDLSGAPLDNGYIYIGTENLNPEVNLISIYWDEASTTPAANPVRTIAGYPSRNGSPGRIFAKAAFSITVKDKNSQLVYSSLSSNNIVQNTTVGTIAALRTTVYSGQPIVSVTGYYTASDNIGVREYYWDSTSVDADNGGTIIQVTGVVTGRWKMKYSGTVNVKWFGAKGDGVTDDTLAIQAAINFASLNEQNLFFKSGIYRTTSTLTITKGLTIHGVHPVIKTPGMTGNTSGGTWLFFDHLGKGITVINTNGYFTDTTFIDIGTKRNQPAPAVAWAPVDADYDLYIFGAADVTLRYVTMLNPTRGVGLFGDPANGPGRLEIYNFKAQAFKIGIMIDTTYDVTRMDNIHFWPFWYDDMNIHTYTMNNLDAIYSLRNDNPLMTNIFSIFARSGLRIGQGVNGGTSKIHLANADFDRGAFGIWVDTSVTTGCTGQFANITTQGETGFAGSKGIFVEGNSCTFDFANYESGYSMQNAVRVDGTGNVISFGAAKAISYDQELIGFPAYEAATGNFITFAIRPKAVNGGVGVKFGLTGTLIVDEWREFTPTITSETGTITTLGAKSGYYKLVGNTVYVQFDFIIITNGTGGGAVRIALPFGTTLRPSVGSGREIIKAGKMLNIYVPTTTGLANIYNYDNTYPGVDGGRYVGVFEYDINVGI